MGESAVSVRELGATAGAATILHDISFDVPTGEIVTLCGPSGAGKTTIAAAVAGIVRPGITYSGELVRGGHVGYLPQFAAATLNPARRIGHALGELVGLHHVGRLDRAGRRVHIARVLRTAGFDVPDDRLDQTLRRYPHEFSGGERTRLALAQVLTANPTLLVLDEPTSGLDAISRAAVVDQLDTLRRDGMTILLVTHDLLVAARLSHRTLHVSGGRLVDAVSQPDPASPPATRSHSTGAAVELRGVTVTRSRTAILHDVDLELAAGETLGVVGVSGAGKSTLARVIAGLQEIRRGSLLVDGRPMPTVRSRSREQIAHVQYVWQEAAGSFETRRSVLDQVAMTGVWLAGLSPADARAEAVTELAELGIDETQARRYPAGLSGGQLQRAAVARALLARPSVLICDEVTTGLDEPLSRRILDRIEAYRRDAAASVILISHDVRTQLSRADRLVVVDAGRIVATGVPADLSNDSTTTVLHRLLAPGRP
nr:ATP-binding cassette domain-containing protein [Pseudonocardia spinosispora]